MIVVTGGAGFIGSAFVEKLNREGIDDIVIVDDLDKSEKWKNLVGKSYQDYLGKDDFLEELDRGFFNNEVDAVIHFGACSSTTEKDSEYLMENNFRFSRILAEWCWSLGVRFIGASSAAVYGDGSLGFSDSDELTLKLRPLNMYGYSKQLTDLWAIRSGVVQKAVFLRFFNVFGPNEYHKENMTSVVYKAFNQIRETGKLKLFKSYRPDFEDGKQLRDFIYVKDAIEIVWHFFKNPEIGGIFNVGTGESRSWLDLGKAVFAAMNAEEKIEFVEMPNELRGKYQYFTKADISKLRSSGYSREFRNLENAIEDYVKNYLSAPSPYL